jgi:phage terminase large subunit-like protein
MTLIGPMRTIGRSGIRTFRTRPSATFLRALCREAQRNPRLENEFKQFHCGIWTKQATRWFPMHKWRDNTRAPDDLQLWKKLETEMTGRPALAGVDLASSQDIAAASWLFPPQKPGERTTILRRFFCPEDKIAERDSIATPYRRWVADGALIATPGNVTDYDAIEAHLKRDAEQFRVKRADPKGTVEFDIAIDRFDATQVTTHLMDSGFKVARYGQEYSNMNAPARELERLFIKGALEHGNHPVAKWMYGNAAYRRDHRGYIKPDKEKASDKIDGVVSDCMALGIAMRWPAGIDLDDWLKNPLIVRGA